MVAMGYCTDVADIISAVLMYKVAAWSGVPKPDHRLCDTCPGTTHTSDRIWQMAIQRQLFHVYDVPNSPSWLYVDLGWSAISASAGGRGAEGAWTMR